MPNKPYKFIGRNKLLQAKHIAVYEENWHAVKGSSHLYDVVRSPDAVVIVAIDDEDNILLVSQHRAGAGMHILECPAGGIDYGESALDSARRELREETGFSSSTFTEIGSFWTIPGFASEKMFVFMATDLFYDPLAPDIDEDLELSKVQFTQIISDAGEGKIVDAKTISALFLADAYRKRLV